MKDKDLVIPNLNGQIVSLKQENMSCREKVSSEQETVAKKLKMEMQKLRNEKLKIENENERLPIAIKVKSDNIDNMKHIYEESLHEKDKLVDNLHDRLQTQMHDVQGVPWTNIPKQVASPIHNVYPEMVSVY
jgi:regulator of replication initiation timing